MATLLYMGQEILRKLDFAKNGILEKYDHFLQRNPFLMLETFIFSDACAIEPNLRTNELLKKIVLENMGYWQNESDKRKQVGNGSSERPAQDSKK